MNADDQHQPSPQVKAVRLVELAPKVIHALAVGDLEAANRAAVVTLSPYFVAPESSGVWRRRSRQLAADPSAERWITGVIVDIGRELAVGQAGCHGPPDSAGMVELGYAVDPAYRRQGYARAALVAMLDRAEREPSIRTVRATIRRDNTASRLRRRSTLRRGGRAVG